MFINSVTGRGGVHSNILIAAVLSNQLRYYNGWINCKWFILHYIYWNIELVGIGREGRSVTSINLSLIFISVNVIGDGANDW